jgi:hypothetical protein
VVEYVKYTSSSARWNSEPEEAPRELVHDELLPSVKEIKQGLRALRRVEHIAILDLTIGSRRRLAATASRVWVASFSARSSSSR